MSREPIAVEILHTPDCGHWRAARDAVIRVAGEEAIPVALADTTVRTADEAQALRFAGSPTVRLWGRDLQPEVEEAADFGLG